MAEIVLQAKKRELGTQGAMNQLRKSGLVPGVFYLKGKDQINFSVEEVVLNKLVFTSATNIIALTIDGEEPLSCIIKDVQFDPVTDKVVHFDLLGLTLGQTLQLEIPINFVGTAAGIQEGGILQELLHKLDVECLPRHIPQNLEVDITNLALGESIHVRDLEFEDIKILNSEDASVASVIQPRVEEDVDADEDEGEDTIGVEEPEVVDKGKVDEE